MESDEIHVLSTKERYGPFVGVQSVAMSADMKLVAGGCDDNVVRIWDAKTGDYSLLAKHSVSLRIAAEREVCYTLEHYVFLN